MEFRTKLPFTNRQVKQYEKTDIVLSGASQFGLPFSALTAGVDCTTSATTETVGNLISTFSGNASTTVFTWADSRMSLADNAFSALTDTNSGITQNSGNLFVISSSTVIDDNTVNLAYTGVQFSIRVGTMIKPSPTTFSGTVNTGTLYVLSAGTLDFKERTIWVDNPEITRTKKLIVTNNPTIGYALVCKSTEGEVEYQPVSGITSGVTFWEEDGTGNTALKDEKGGHTIYDVSDYSIIAGGFGNQISAATKSIIAGGQSGWMEGGQYNAMLGGFGNQILKGLGNSEFSVILGGRNNTITDDSDYVGILASFGCTIQDSDVSSIVGSNGSIISGTSGGASTINIFGGKDNSIYHLASGFQNNTIVGGDSNTIYSSSDFNSTILGGQNNIMNFVNRSVILGGSGITATTDDTVYVPQMRVVNGNIIHETAGTAAGYSDGTNTYAVIYKDSGALGTDSTLLNVSTDGGVSNTGVGVEDGIISHYIDIGAFAMQTLVQGRTDTGNLSNYMTDASHSALSVSASTIIQSPESVVTQGIKNSVVIGGSGITATTDDTVYVPNLNIQTVGSGTPLTNLGVDVNGNVVSGTTGGGGGAFTHTASGRIAPTNAYGNSVAYNYSSTLGGNGNQIGLSGDSRYSVIGGGYQNKVSQASRSFIGGGSYNQIHENWYSSSFTHGFIGGGYRNIIGDIISTGTTNNRPFYTAIVGGSYNQIYSQGSLIGAGSNNYIGGGVVGLDYGNGSFRSSIVGGGNNKVVNSQYSFIGGGENNIISGVTTFGPTLRSGYSAILGGGNNLISGSTDSCTIVGGWYNVINSANRSTILGGEGNNIWGEHNTVGGKNNVINYSGLGTSPSDFNKSCFVVGLSNTINWPSNYSSIIGSGGVINHSNAHIIGSNITSVSANTTHVEKLNIKTLNGTTAATLLAIDSNGMVVDGSSLDTGGAFTHTASGRIAPTNAYGNTSTSNFASVLGGSGNTIGVTSTYSSIGGGENNNISTSSSHNFIGAGQGNQITGTSVDSFIGGGINNKIYSSSYRSFIGGGNGNKIHQDAKTGFIGGGINNEIELETYYCSIVGGDGNRIYSASETSIIGGGRGNYITNSIRSSILGGSGNTINGVVNGQMNIIGGGIGNKIVNTDKSVIGGGESNYINLQKSSYGYSEQHSVIVGGSGNTIGGTTYFGLHFIGGGKGNEIELLGPVGIATIVGGENNRIQGTGGNGFIGGGEGNTLQGSASFIGCGENNSITGQKSIIVGGRANNINSANTTIINGSGNTINSNTGYSIIGSGKNNDITTGSQFSSILGGQNNTINHTNAHIIGSNITSVSANTTHVEKLNVGTLNGTTAVHGLGLDANGMVVSASTGGGGAFTHTASGRITPTNVYGNYLFTSDYSTIIGGKNNSGTTSTYSIIGGDINRISASTLSTILVGRDNTITGGNRNSILGGQENRIYENSTYSIIGNGLGNKIKNSNKSAILHGGNNNDLFAGTNSCIIGGQDNFSNSTYYSLIGGGKSNYVTGTYNIVVGGSGNTINDKTTKGTSVINGRNNGVTNKRFNYSLIAGGKDNSLNATEADKYCIIGGGYYNRIISINTDDTANSVIGGGRGNLIQESTYATIAGGWGNEIYKGAKYSTIGGGINNKITSTNTSLDIKGSTIGGGSHNEIRTNSDYSTIAGGDSNLIRTGSTMSFIGGGKSNEINFDNRYSSIVGGYNNEITPSVERSTILGGSGNTVNHNDAHIIGSNLTSISANTTHVDDLIIVGLNSVTDLQTNAFGKLIDGASDITLKDNIEPIEGALDKILKLKPVSFEWKPEIQLRNGRVFGLIAQEVNEVIPEIVRERAKSDGKLTLEYKELIPWLIKSVQELSDPNSTLFQRNEVVLNTQTITAEDNIIELNYGGNHDTAVAGGLTVIDGVRAGVHSHFKINDEGWWVASEGIIPKQFIAPKYTPLSSDDVEGKTGEMTWDKDYIYIKTEDGWKRSALEKF
jgi:hypothetical protein